MREQLGHESFPARHEMCEEKVKPERSPCGGRFLVSGLTQRTAVLFPYQKWEQSIQSSAGITRRHHLSAKGYQQRLEAGLLTSGSTRVSPFPPSWLMNTSETDWQWICDSVPGYSGGTVTELHRLPFSVAAVGFKHDNTSTSTVKRPA